MPRARSSRSSFHTETRVWSLSSNDSLSSVHTPSRWIHFDEVVSIWDIRNARVAIQVLPRQRSTVVLRLHRFSRELILVSSRFLQETFAESEEDFKVARKLGVAKNWATSFRCHRGSKRACVRYTFARSPARFCRTSPSFFFTESGKDGRTTRATPASPFLGAVGRDADADWQINGGFRESWRKDGIIKEMLADILATSKHLIIAINDL